MSLFSQLTEKPWVTVQGMVVDIHGGRAFPLSNVKVGLRIFLGVIAVLFSLFIVSYVDRMTLGDWRPLPEPWVLWLNTALLVLSSVALQWAWNGADRGQIERVRTGLLAGGVFAFAFLAGQLLAWQQMISLGYFAATNPANAFFYLFTALHAVHLLGGLVAWGRTATKVWRGCEVGDVRVSVELCTTYWHFLLVIWLILFVLLLMT